MHGVVREVRAIGDACGRLKPLENLPESLSKTPIKYEQLIPYYEYLAISLAASENVGIRFEPSMQDNESI